MEVAGLSDRRELDWLSLYLGKVLLTKKAYILP